ncbi:MAG TPA: SDR family NAD(P)-dependent oxidoreductase, partial [Herpetosiphonaceae bacterium]|nr:SDR family NAD(P)-dependent oxidoreductase [Herpetosiphonaceae bacterium]
LVTGGARGITADVAQELAERYRPTLVLAGRSPLPPAVESAATAGLSSPQELKGALIAQLQARGQQVTPTQVEKAYGQLLNECEIRENMLALERTGARVRYYPVDVRDEQAFGGLIDEIYRTFGRLDGVIHGAGIIEDKLVKDKTVESFDRVVSTKVDSAFVLSRHLRPESLRFLIFFSSVSGRFGNRGQADYAAANEVLNKLAVDLDRRWPARVVAINWGPWKKLGMVSPELEKEFARRGVTLISPAAGRRALNEEIRFGRKGAAEVVIMGAPGGKETIAEGSAGAHPLLRGLVVNTSASGVEVIRTLDPAHDVYLRDHQLDGKPVLPFAMAMELMAEVVQQAWSDLKVTGLRDMQLFKGLVIENGPKRIRITARAQQDPPAERVGADVSVEITDAERPTLRYYRATVELSDRLPEPPAYAPAFTTDLDPFPLSVDDAYRQWLFHGPLFERITEIVGIGDQSITATLATSVPWQCLADGGEGEWLIDPVVVDCGLQLIILWTRARLDMTSLPARFGRYQRFGPLSAERIQCHLHVLDRRQEQVLNYNVYFVGSDGRLLGLLEDMECPYSQALNRLADRADGQVASRQAIEAAAD